MGRTDKACVGVLWTMLFGCSAVIALTIPGYGAEDARSLEPKKRPNVLFLLSDDQRPDTIAAMGNRQIQTPHLDKLVRGGTVFTRAVSPNPICVTARAEIMTGCCGMRDGYRAFGSRIGARTCWAETMAAAGYRTWYVGKWHTEGTPAQRGYRETLGLFAGGGGRWITPQWDANGRRATGYVGWLFRTDDGRLMPERGVGLTPDISRAMADAAIELIRRRPAEPFFLHVNFTAPHDPLLMPPGYQHRYDPRAMRLPANFLPEHPFDHGNANSRDEELFAHPRTAEEVRKELAVYYAVITHMDEQIGRILDALGATGQADNTIVIFASDQGLAIGSHGLRGKQNMYEHTVGTPLVLSGPGIPRGQRRAAQCYLRDLYPTICELSGVKVPGQIDGRSLVPVLCSDQAVIHPAVFGYFRDVQRMIRTDRWKLIHYPRIGRYQLFDLARDPDEQHDESANSALASVQNGLRTQLEEWQKQMGDPSAGVKPER